jgi:hypothetical protein
MTMIPPRWLEPVGISLKHSRAQATASGNSSVLISAFPVVETNRLPIARSTSPNPNWVPNRKSLSRSVVVMSNGAENGQMKSGHSRA